MLSSTRSPGSGRPDQRRVGERADDLAAVDRRPSSSTAPGHSRAGPATTTPARHRITRARALSQPSPCTAVGSRSRCRRQKTERLLNLVICLLATPPAHQQGRRSARAVPRLRRVPTDDAFERMFERDKEELRELGIPLETGSNSAWFDDELGYRIRRDAYALPEVSFEPDETGGARPGRAGLAAGDASPGRPPARCSSSRPPAWRPAESSLAGHRAAGRRQRAGVRAALRRRARPARRSASTTARPRTGSPTSAPSSRGGSCRGTAAGTSSGHDRDRDATRVFRLSPGRRARSTRAGRAG